MFRFSANAPIPTFAPVNVPKKTIIVRNLSGGEMEFTVPENISILRLKEKIIDTRFVEGDILKTILWKQPDITNHKTRVIFDNNGRLNEYNINNNDTLYIFVDQYPNMSGPAPSAPVLQKHNGQFLGYGGKRSRRHRKSRRHCKSRGKKSRKH